MDLKSPLSVLVFVVAALSAACDPPLPLTTPPPAESSDAGAPVDTGDPGATAFSEAGCDPQPGGVGEWQTVGNMVNAERIGGTATVLDNGDILVVGGWPATEVQACGETPPDIIDTVERYSAATGDWHRAAPLSIGRWYHTATKLKDGRVLVAGGLGPEYDTEFYPQVCPADATAEIYDPVTNSWAPTPPMPYARAGAVATLLADGRVLVIGGTGTGSTEIYDPALDTWQEASPTQIEIDEDTVGGALLLKDGSVFAAGYAVIGSGASAIWTLETELYDPIEDEWRSARPLPVAADGNPVWNLSTIMQPLPSGRVMVALNVNCLSGCFTPNGMPEETAYIEAPQSGAWTVTPPLPSISFGPASVALSDGRVLIAGGGVLNAGGGGSTLTASIFDELSMTWTKAAEMPHPRSRLLLTAFGADGALAIGGDEDCDRDGEYIDSNELPVDRFWFHPSLATSP